MSTDVKRYKMDAPEYGLVEADCCSSCEAVKENCADCTAVCDNPKEIEWVRDSDYIKLAEEAKKLKAIAAGTIAFMARNEIDKAGMDITTIGIKVNLLKAIKEAKEAGILND